MLHLYLGTMEALQKAQQLNKLICTVYNTERKMVIQSDFRDLFFHISCAQETVLSLSVVSMVCRYSSPVVQPAG